MEIADLINYYPRLYHVGEPGSWPQVQRLGLLSTTAALDLFGITAERRRAIELDRRSESVLLEHPDQGIIRLRDQKPLSLPKLQGCLQDGLTCRDWLRLLNGKVFFWVREHRVRGLSQAQAYAGTRQQIITVDTAELLSRHGNRVQLSPMNSGTTRPMAFPRGRSTFKPIEGYDFAERRRARGVKDAIAELTVDYAVPDIAEITLLVQEVGGSEPDSIIWER